jgi:hypothetical protein
MNDDIISIEITEEGLIKSTTPKISQPNHSSAAEFFRAIARLANGVTTVTKRSKATHTHAVETNTLKGGQ